MTDVWDNAGTGSATARWVRAAGGIAVASLSGVPSGPTSSIPVPDHVAFTRPVDASTFDADDVVLTSKAAPTC